MSLGELAPGWVTAEQLFADDTVIERLLAEQARHTSDLDQKARACYLMIAYSSMLSVVAAVPLAGFGLFPDLSPARFGLSLSRNNDTGERQVFVRLTSSFTTARPELKSHPDAQFLRDHEALRHRFREGIEAHLTPLIAVLRRKSGLAAAAFWRLAGDSFAGNLLEAGRRLDCEEHAKQTALAVLKHPGSPLANREMHYFDITIRDPDEARPPVTRTFRARGGCCRFYTSSKGHLCSTCVLQSERDRRNILEKAMRQKLGLPQSTSAAFH